MEKIGADNTWIDFCKHYGGDCGCCFQRDECFYLPGCFDPNRNFKETPGSGFKKMQYVADNRATHYRANVRKAERLKKEVR